MRLVMLGTGTFAEPTFLALLRRPEHQVVGLVTQPDRHGGAETGSTRQIGQGMKAIAQSAGIPVFQPESINTPEGAEKLKSWNADLLVTAAYGQILKAEILETTQFGGINVHGSLLPKYRGAAPVAWAIWRGETETGVTIIRMTTGLDAGAMLAKRATPIGPDETAGEVEARLSLIGAELAVEVVNQLANGSVEGEMQDPAQVTKAPKLTKEHGIIDWTRPADEISRQVRALQPWPTAYTFLHRANQPPLRIIVLASEAINGHWQPAGACRPSADQQAIEVATGMQVLRITALQAAGKKRMSAADFLRGRPLQVGDRLGPMQ